jgi:hypothetical protein
MAGGIAQYELGQLGSSGVGNLPTTAAQASNNIGSQFSTYDVNQPYQVW